MGAIHCFNPVYCHRQQAPHRRYDVVVAAYVLCELSGAAERARAVEALWARTGSVLILVEPGTPSGYGSILDARTQASV